MNEQTENRMNPATAPGSSSQGPSYGSIVSYTKPPPAYQAQDSMDTPSSPLLGQQRNSMDNVCAP